jgi:hypothetical protein
VRLLVVDRAQAEEREVDGFKARAPLRGRRGAALTATEQIVSYPAPEVLPG